MMHAKKCISNTVYAQIYVPGDIMRQHIIPLNSAI